MPVCISPTATADSATMARIASSAAAPSLAWIDEATTPCSRTASGSATDGISECRVRPASTSTTTSARPASIGLPDATNSVRWNSESCAR